MRDETDSWNYPQLELFKNCPILNVRRVEVIARRAEHLIDEEKVGQFSEYKKSLKEAEKGEDNDLSVCVETGGRQILRGDHPRFGRAAFFPQGGRGSKVDGTLSSGRGAVRQVLFDQKKGTEGGERRHADPSQARERCTRRAVDRPIHHRSCPSSGGTLPGGDAFIRNQKDIPPFVRAFYKQHRRFPSTEETLHWLRANGCYSGEWEENEGKRAKRVQQILTFTQQTFDPTKLSNGDSPELSLRLAWIPIGAIRLRIW